MTARVLFDRLSIWLALLATALSGYLLSRNRLGLMMATNGGSVSGVAVAGSREQSSGRAPEPLQSDPRRPLMVGVLGLAGMVIFLIFAPRAAAGGWLVAFLFWSSISIGSVTAMMIHALTGGRWGWRFNAVFMPSAATVPLMALLFAPVLAALPAFYGWALGSGSVEPDVSQFYLNAPYFIGRSLIAFFGWSLLAYTLPRLTGWAAVLTAAIGLVFHGLIIGLIGVDWILSLEPPFISTSFGASLAVTQLAAALAWALIASPDREEDTGLGDLAGLLLATLLGLTYINFMALLIIWYGDLPNRVFWFVQRDHWPWMLIAVLAFVGGSVIPIFSLFLARVRYSASWLRVVGIIVLAGIAIYYVYLIAPPFGVLSIAAAVVALVAIGALSVALVVTGWSRAGYEKWRHADER